MTKENQQQPASGAMTDELILQISADAGLPCFNDEQRVRSIRFAHALLSRAQDAQAIRNAALEESVQPIREALALMNSMIACGEDHTETSRAVLAKAFAAIRALQSAPAQPVERPCTTAFEDVSYEEVLKRCQQYFVAAPAHPVELPKLSDPIGEMRDSGVVWFGQNPHAYPIVTKFYGAAIAANQPQRGNAQEPFAWYCLANNGATYMTTNESVADFHRKDGWTVTPLYAAAPQVAQVEGARTVIKQCITLAQKRLLEPPSEFREIDFINALGWIRDRLKEVLAAPQPDAQQSSEKGEQA